MKEAIIIIVQYLLAPLATMIGGYLVGRRKDRAEAKKIEANATSAEAEASGIELNNVEKALAIYRGIVDDLAVTIRGLEKRVVDLQGTIKQLEDTIHSLESENKNLKKQVKHYESKS